MEHLGTPIVTLEEFAELRPSLGRVVATSGGFDPIHPGHISCIIESAGFGDVLVVIVNGVRGAWALRKGGFGEEAVGVFE